MTETLVANADDLAWFAATAPAMDGLLTPYGFIDVEQLSDAGRVDALVALERLRSWADAQQARVLAGVQVAAEHAGDDKEFVRDEVACALRLSPVAVGERMHVGRHVARQTLWQDD